MGLLIAVLRPLIEHYVDVGASYIAVGLRFTLIWGSVALIAWAVLRILQQTSAATLVLNPQDPEQTQLQQQNDQMQMVESEIYSTGEYVLDHPRPRYLQQQQHYGVGSSAESIYSTTTTSSSSSGSSTGSSLYYSPPAPQYNPYSGSGSPIRGNSPTRLSPIRKMVPGSNGGSPSPVSNKPMSSSPSPVRRRMEPRIVPLDDPTDDSSAYRPYPTRLVPQDVNHGTFKLKQESINVLEKPAGQGAFRLQRKV